MERFAYCILAYQNVDVVRRSVESAIANYSGEIFIVSNNPFDQKTVEYINDLGRTNQRVHIFRLYENIGCHRGFEVAWNWAIAWLSEGKTKPDYLIKADDSFMCPVDVNWENLAHMLDQQSQFAMVGTNFFNDGRLNETDQALDTDLGKLTFWNGRVINLPWGIIRRDFYDQVGVNAQYRTAKGEVVNDQNHLYGGEEAYWCKRAAELGLDWGYLYNVRAEHVGNDVLESTYQAWKYAYGYLGTYKKDYLTFLQDEQAVSEVMRHWQEHSDNGMHQEWSKNWLTAHIK